VRAKADDPDIIATSSVMSLKCPLSTMRMQLPCRGIACQHNQCFDATAYLQTQEQAPQWSCPTCNKICRIEDLALDEYVQDILDKTSKDTEQVTVEPNGDWRQVSKDDRERQSQASSKAAATKDVKIHEIHDLDDMPDTNHRPNGFHRAGSTSTASFHTPDASSRAPSAAISTTQKQGKKRGADDVIDLTLDDDEEDEPPRQRIKRSSTGASLMAPNGSNGYKGYNAYSASPSRPLTQPSIHPLHQTDTAQVDSPQGFTRPTPQSTTNPVTFSLPHYSNQAQQQSQFGMHGYDHWQPRT